MKNTLVVNLFGAQGSGKSTMMAGIFSKLKLMGYDCEMCPEFAKELVWENRMETFSDELYLFAKQNHRLFRLKGKVDIVITDRPLYMSIPYYRYYKGANETYEQLVRETFYSYRNLNIFIKRCKPFNPNGRNETEQESNDFGNMLLDSLDNEDFKYLIYDGTEESIEPICNIITHFVNINQEDETKSNDECVMVKSSKLTWFENEALEAVMKHDRCFSDEYDAELKKQVTDKMVSIFNSNANLYDIYFYVMVDFNVYQKMVVDKVKLGYESIENDKPVAETLDINSITNNECMVNFIPVAKFSNGKQYGLLKKKVTVSTKQLTWMDLYGIIHSSYDEVFAGFC